MPKQTYVPTEADRLTGANVRALRRLAGETLIETLERSGLQLGQSSLSRIELGERPLSLPEATKLAAHWNTIPEKIIARPAPAPVTVSTEQEWLGNEPATSKHWLGNQNAPLFAVPDKPLYTEAELAEIERSICPPTQLVIDLQNPLTLDEYREQVWIPYLEARYSADLKAS
jgi:transcriptional regulator with XRE-family HTH domain